MHWLSRAASACRINTTHFIHSACHIHPTLLPMKYRTLDLINQIKPTKPFSHIWEIANTATCALHACVCVCTSPGAWMHLCVLLVSFRVLVLLA